MNLDLQDPAVQELLSPKESHVVLPGSSKKAVMSQIAGDEDHGFTSTQYLNRGKHEVGVVFRPKRSITMVAGVLTVDVYAIPGEPVKLHLICPRCQHTLTVDADKKAIEWDPAAPNPLGSALREVLPAESAHLASNLGVVSVAEFQCTWELEDEKHDTGKDTSLIVQGSLCRFRGVIDKNVLREA